MVFPPLVYRLFRGSIYRLCFVVIKALSSILPEIGFSVVGFMIPRYNYYNINQLGYKFFLKYFKVLKCDIFTLINPICKGDPGAEKGFVYFKV
jgi:hypothetical protein